MKNKKRVQETADAYSDNNNDVRYDPLGMYTGRPVDIETAAALRNGYKLYIRPDGLYPDQDADDI